MNTQIVAIVIQECSRLFGELIRNRKHKIPPVAIVEESQEEIPELAASALTEYPKEEVKAPAAETKKASDIATGCVPCSMGHLGTCTGLLNEAMRFAKKDGIESGEVIDRVGMCMDELNALERVDLRPEMITALPDWQRELANQALTQSRSMRHDLEGLTTVNQLEKIAASTQSARKDIYKVWFRERLARMSPEEKAQLSKKVEEQINARGETTNVT